MNSLQTNDTLKRGKAFLELITAISVKQRAIALSIVNQFELYDYNDYKTKQDGKRRHVYTHSVRYLQESGETWQFIIESQKDNRGYTYLAPDKAGNRAFFPVIPSDIRKLISDRYCVDVPLEGSFWDWLANHPEIPILITEGGGKALSGLSHGFVSISLFGCSCLASPDLERYLKDRDIAIAFDSDTKLSAVRAVKTALAKHLKPLSKLAKSVKVVTWNSQHKGLDDLLAAKGATALETVINNALSSENWLSNHKIKIAHDRLEDNKIKADLELDRLPTFKELQKLYKTHRDLFLVGAKGLGKSELGGEFVRNADYALIPTPLESLARNNAQRMSQGDRTVDYRTDCDRVNGQLIGSDGYVNRLAFCTEAIQGLKRFIAVCLDRNASVLNDELDLQLNSLATSSTHAQNGKRKTNETHYWNMQIRAKQTLSVSADLTKYESKIWEQKTGRKPFVIRVNTAKKKYDATLFDDALSMEYNDLDPQIKAGKRILICCSRKSEAKFLAWRLKDYGAIAIHRDNANEPMFEGFFENPNQWLEQNQPRILIVSPVLRSGFSITRNSFDSVFCFFHADSISASTALQLSDRYRLPVPRFIYAAESSGKYRHCTPKDIVITSKGRAAATGEDESEFIDENDYFYQYKSSDNWSKAHFKADIIARLHDEVEIDGEIEIEPSILLKDDYIRRKAEREAYKEYEIARLYNARNLAKVEYESMKDRRDLLEADLLAIDKYKLADWSALTPDNVTEYQIERDDKGRKRKALERLEYQSFPSLAIKADKHSIETQTKWGAGVSHQDVTHLALAQKALEQLGVHDFLDFVLSGGTWYVQTDYTTGEISAGTPIAIEFGQKLKSMRNCDVHYVDKKGKAYTKQIDKLAEIGIHLTCAKHAGLTTYIGALLAWLGLKRDNTQETINGVRTRIYSLHKADLKITCAELTRRAERMINEGVDLSPSHPFVESVVSLHTPFYNNNRKGCVQVKETIKSPTVEPVAAEVSTPSPTEPSPNLPPKPSNTPPKNEHQGESLIERIRRLNEPLAEMQAARYSNERYGFSYC